MARRRARDGIVLSFARVECRCGDLRIAGIVCPECGERPRAHEVDHQRQRRDKVADIALSITEASAQVPDSSNPLAFMSACADMLASWLTDLWRILNTDRVEHEVLIEHIKYLNGLSEAVRDARRLRPWRSQYKMFDDLMVIFRDILKITMEAYRAPTPIEAQRAQVRMQLRIDEAARIGSLFSESLGELGDLSETEGVMEKALFVVSMQLSDHAGSEGAEALLSKVPAGVAIPPGTRELIGAGVRYAQMLGEESSLVEISEETFQVLTARPDRTQQTLQDQRFQELFARATTESYFSAETFDIVMAAARHEQVMLDGLLEIAHALVESATRPHIALIASSLGNQGYRRFLEAGANKTIRFVQDAGHALLVDGLSIDLRNAKAHRGYRFNEDRTLVEILRDNGNLKRTMDGPEIADSIISAQVTYLGLMLGCFLSAVALEEDAVGLLGSTEFLSTETNVEIGALMIGWPRPKAVLSDADTALHLRGTPPIAGFPVDSTEFLNLQAAMVIARLLPDSVQLLYCYDSGDQPISIDVGVAKSSIVDGDSQAATLVSFLRTVRRGQEHLLPDEQWRAMMLALASTAVKEGFPKVIRKLRILRNVAEEHEDEELATALDATLRMIAAQFREAGQHTPIAHSELPIQMITQY